MKCTAYGIFNYVVDVKSLDKTPGSSERKEQLMKWGYLERAQVVRQYIFTPGSMWRKEETRNDGMQGLIAVCSSRTGVSFARCPFLGYQMEVAGGLDHSSQLQDVTNIAE